MNITESKLRRIIRESLRDEFEARATDEIKNMSDAEYNDMMFDEEADDLMFKFDKYCDELIPKLKEGLFGTDSTKLSRELRRLADFVEEHGTTNARGSWRKNRK